MFASRAAITATRGFGNRSGLPAPTPPRLGILPLLAIAAAAGLARATIGSIQANQEKQRQKGIIGKAYKLGLQRQNLRQQDTRQSVAESSVARGLAQGGGVTVGGPATPALNSGVGGAHDLGSQQTADLGREQNLEAYGLEQEKDRALSDTKAAATSGILSSIGAGINTGMSVYGMGQEKGALSAMKDAGPASGIGAGVQVDSPPPGWTPTRFPGSYQGIDPLNPVTRTASNADFNKYSSGMNG